MKHLTLLFFAALSLAGTAWAQQAAPTPAPALSHHPNLPPGGPHPGGPPPGVANQLQITPAEWQELRTARTAALQADPGLTEENRKLSERMRALDAKIEAAIAKSDPALAPVIAKIDAMRRPQGMPPGARPAVPPPPPSAPPAK